MTRRALHPRVTRTGASAPQRHPAELAVAGHGRRRVSRLPVHQTVWTQRHPAAFGIETCGSRASSATLALPRRLEAALDGKWTCDEQLDKFRGPFSAFASSWTGLAQADKLKGRQCISLLLF